MPRLRRVVVHFMPSPPHSMRSVAQRIPRSFGREEELVLACELTPDMHSQKTPSGRTMCHVWEVCRAR